MNNLQIRISELCRKFDKYDDETLQFYFFRNQNIFIKDYLIKRNYIELYKKLDKRIMEHSTFEKNIEKTLSDLDKFNVPIIGLKGYFLQKTYYKDIPRLYNDLDLFVNVKDCYTLYQALKNLNYKIKQDSFLFYNNPILFNIFKGSYANKLHSIDLEKNAPIHESMCKWEKAYLTNPIELLCNLNVGSHHLFNNNELFNKCFIFENYNNIYQLNKYHNIVYLIIHIMQHLAFYKPVSNSLSINIQRVIDIFFIIESMGSDFNIEKLLDLSKTINAFPEVLFFLNLYSKLNLDTKYYNLDKYYLEPFLKKCPWYFILHESRNMNVEDILIGNYSQFPNLLQTINENYNIKIQDIKTLRIKKCIHQENFQYKARFFPI